MKSILIFNTPTRCYDCPLYTSIGYEDGSTDEYGFCDDRNILKQKEAQEKIRFDEKPTWCPLKQMPSKRETDIETDLSSGDDYISGYKDGYNRGVDVGWNRCVSELSGGIE